MRGLRTRIGARVTRSPPFVVWLMLAGCAGTVDLADLREVPPFDLQSSGAPPSQRSALAPLDAKAEGDRGDQILAEIRLEVGERTERRFVRLTIESDLEMTTMEGSAGLDGHRIMRTLGPGEVRIDVMEADGREIATRLIEHELLIEVEQDEITERSEEALVRLFNLVQTTPELAELLNAVAKRPSPLALLRAGGLRVLIATDVERAERVVHRGIEAIRVPAWILMEGETLLEGTLICTWMQSPYLLTAGVLRIEARHPSYPERRAVVELVHAGRAD